jgi:hypothetical protein
VIRDGSPRVGYQSLHGESPLTEDFYGYVWDQAIGIGQLVFTAGRVRPDGGWFETLQVQYLNEQGQWVPVRQMSTLPDITSPQYRRDGRIRFNIIFKPVKTTGIRIIGKPGGPARFTSIAELEVYEK